jgi:phosphate transport system permease protein
MAILSTDPPAIRSSLRGSPRIVRRDRTFRVLLVAGTLVSLAVLVVLLVDLMSDSFGVLSPRLLLNYPSISRPDEAGARSALLGSLWLMTLTAGLAVPIGIGAAIYLEEFANDTRLNRAIETNIANLAGIPSVVYGLLGLGVFVYALELGRILLAGAMTLALLVLPVVIIASREALRAVPTGIREGAFALGATRWEVVRNQVLPASIPGVMTGTILALSRAIGEAAPLVVIGAFAYTRVDPTPVSIFSAVPVLILAWVTEAKEIFHTTYAAAASVLLVVALLSMNAVAIWVRNRYQREW